MDFDLDRSIDQAWTGFAGRLGEVVSVMDPGATLTVGAAPTGGDGAGPFVRFTCLADRNILTEASGNAVLTEDQQVDVAGLQRLADLGWEPPSVDGERAGPNHWFVLSEENSDAIAARAVMVLREVFHVRHPAFLSPDQLAEVLTPVGPSEGRPTGVFPAADLQAQVPTSAKHLEELVRAELAKVLGYEPLRDTDGDFAIRVGSAMVFVRCTPDAQEVLVFSPVVHEIEGRSLAMEVLSDLNAEARYFRFLLIRDRVYASMSVLSHPFVPAHLHQALGAMTTVADAIDEELARRLRGRTSFGVLD